MTLIPDSHLDLLESKFATLATIGRDGIPQLTEVWFLYEDGKVKVSLNRARLKTKNLMRRPQCSVFILDLANPRRYIDIRGNALLEDDDAYVFADRVGAKYDGADLRTRDQPGDRRVAVTVEPTYVFPVDLAVKAR